MGESIYILAVSLVVVLLGVAVALCCLFISQRRMFRKNYELYEVILRKQRREERERKRQAERQTLERTPNQQLFLRINDLMHKEHLYTDAELNRDALATLLGTNHRYIDEAIRECANGITTNAYINGFRVDHAARLLSETDEPIALIAELSGFANRTSFNEKFRERFKMTPTEVRRAARK